MTLTEALEVADNAGCYTGDHDAKEALTVLAREVRRCREALERLEHTATQVNRLVLRACRGEVVPREDWILWESELRNGLYATKMAIGAGGD